jgi:DNA gyrase subunit A
MPLPEDEGQWESLYAMFATASGDIRRNALSDFARVNANGKIAMKLEEGDKLVAVMTCADSDDILLASHQGKCIRFPVSDIRVFASRNSTGNRGIRLEEGDEVISMSILRHADATTEERLAYIRQANALRRAGDEEPEVADAAAEEEAEGAVAAVQLSEARFAELATAEQFILTISDQGYGKRSSAYEYRITRRGGKGIDLMNLGKGKAVAQVAAGFPVLDADQIMLVTNGGKLIRCPVADIRIAGRNTRGVTLFRIDDGERVVSVAHLTDVGSEGNGDTELAVEDIAGDVPLEHPIQDGDVPETEE